MAFASHVTADHLDSFAIALTIIRPVTGDDSPIPPLSQRESSMKTTTFQLTLICLLMTGTFAIAEEKPSTDHALERTRQTVRMLDDIYKAAVVLITEHYVNDEDDLPAGSAAIALFDAIEKKGWHKVRLIDVTGDPSDEDNVAKDRFEKEVVKLFAAQKSQYEDQVIMHDGKRYLRAITPIPVVLKKCTMCHEHYKDAKPGQAIGALSYTIPIE